LKRSTYFTFYVTFFVLFCCQKFRDLTSSY
jgi:hypothetical protein